MRLLLITILLFISSCSTSENSATIDESSVTKGEKLFKKVHIGKNNVIGCISCHTIKNNEVTVGPALYGIGLRAGLSIEGVSAKNYLKQSIINPDAHIVSGYEPAIMFSHYKDELSEQQIDNLVEYLLSLK